MSLLRQLVIVIVVLFVLLFAGTMFLSISNTRDYLNEQLRTISQDTATSLGMTLSAPMSENDAAIVDRLVSAVSDSGYYREVVVSDVDGKPLVERRQTAALSGVPEWFVRWVPLDTPVGEALVMAGWQQAGTVRVVANPGYAYAALWASTVDAFWWFLAASILAFLLGLLALHVILRPLRAVEAQARAICDREYPVQKTLPWTLELRSVVQAMNRMANKVREMFEEQAASIDRLRAENYRDPVTGLANRKLFDMRLHELTKNTEEVATGALLLLQLHDFKAYNDRLGYKAGDELLHNTAGLLIAISRTHDAIDSFSARLGGADFGVLLKHVGPEQAMQYARAIASALPRFRERGYTETEEVGHIGVAIFKGQSASELLSAADLALRAAQTQGPNAVHMALPETAGTPADRTASQWHTVLRRALDERRFQLQFQPVHATGGGTLHHEVLIRMREDDGSLVPAGVFVPMAKRFELLRELDRYAVSAVMEWLQQPGQSGQQLAVNLFPASIQDVKFVDWLCDLLQHNPALAPCLSFEMAEYGVVENLVALRKFIQRVSAAGARAGLDHFGRGLASFGYLSSLKIDYLKLDGSYTHDIDSNRDNQFFVESVIQIAHGLDIKVIVEAVETEQELALLRTLRADGVQGYAIGAPMAGLG